MERECTLIVKLNEQEIDQMGELDVGGLMNLTQQVVVGSMIAKVQQWIRHRRLVLNHIDSRLDFIFFPDTLYKDEFTTYIFLKGRTNGPAFKVFKAKDKWYPTLATSIFYDQLKEGGRGKELEGVDCEFMALQVASEYLVTRLQEGHYDTN